MGRFVDSLIAYRILTLLVTPFENTEAFKLGIIDKKGKELKTMQQLNTVQQRDAYTLLHRLVYRLKRIIEKGGPYYGGDYITIHTLLLEIGFYY